MVILYPDVIEEIAEDVFKEIEKFVIDVCPDNDLILLFKEFAGIKDPEPINYSFYNPYKHGFADTSAASNIFFDLASSSATSGATFTWVSNTTS